MNFGNFALLRFFIDVIDEGSISGAARTHNISLPAASRKMRQLEHLFGVRLLQRTTRRQSLTEEGVILYEQAVRILGDLETLEDMLRQNSREVAGVLRVTAPVSLGRRRIAPLLAQFGAMYPRLSVHLKLTDTVLDLVASGMDVAIRYGATEDSSYISRPLANNYRILCASPDYVQIHGVPETPQDLIRHRCLHSGTESSVDWSLGDLSVRINSPFTSNDGEVIRQLALDGYGIALKSIWDVADDIESGRLCQILKQYQSQAAPLHAIYPHRQHVAPRVKVFIEFLIKNIREPDIYAKSPS
ncbi:TPA: LysR family transcriptional regulator [Enterobacter hormaechei]|uniref:LysR family transcriptional regulator n=1 Tax=Enterobacteriaceae TaxID=543 RepID=UPI0012587DC3|nr:MULTISPECIES: LysR family transcriptional regulator [Enterobacteriaceae]EEW9678015.1 LysR family transcriptional regulator [Salmonella enterica subsp. enterica]MCW9184012.1 LysR family transcriptional regulator [Klebsiella pneumoniae]MEA1205273.1 LysR family transcriptional regulator [Enterobacter hormaechei]VAM38216.1 LysR family transcriptional regulator [Enterobacter hormaechei]VAM41561.1 LysR family transcriptional regulator [Enterobacter hormaechei]